jgi:hypothetical protein
MMREITGRCHRCLIRFTWVGKPLLRNALCPYCSSALQQTTHLWKGKNERRTPETRRAV